jgi:quercetin dioxygenase-like cupin family protein
MASQSWAADATLPSKMVRFEDLPVEPSDGHALRRILQGKTHNGYEIELHETDLAPGAMPHPPHRHAHEEVFLVREGTVEVTVAGRTSHLGPGSVPYVASNDEHGVKNAGSTHAQYFVMALGTK